MRPWGTGLLTELEHHYAAAAAAAAVLMKADDGCQSCNKAHLHCPAASLGAAAWPQSARNSKEQQNTIEEPHEALTQKCSLW
jgi:hypothetical protein